MIFFFYVYEQMWYVLFLQIYPGMRNYGVFYFEKSEYIKPDVRAFTFTNQNIHLNFSAQRRRKVKVV